ncbi:hypothetical protein L228DRAFT_268627 [Xylona heveae TC161]|uniref:Uncharacterized protein n=1 Tax=Xylona heveae (strain CBS 132557 / TC161) TaxID=1328760 RepID=A0A165GG23_XYLHT|nr:hypothetical protein L228DRAFT_268627 [Xylona heveae TC161]KZF22137.1 hypothetical protein L228DRAFT_268627 [Xylona heveae TC161]
MAAISQPAVVGVLPQRSRSRGGRSSWEYAVPLSYQNGRPLSTAEQSSDSVVPPYDNRSYKQPRTNNAKRISGHYQSYEMNPSGGGRDENSPTYARSNAYSGAYPLPQRQVHALDRKESDMSGRGSDRDSLLDLYGSSSRNRSAVSSTANFGGQDDVDHHLNMEFDPGSSHWIHRDKLAEIESRELKEAGIRLPAWHKRHYAKPVVQDELEQNAYEEDVLQRDPMYAEMDSYQNLQRNSMADTDDGHMEHGYYQPAGSSDDIHSAPQDIPKRPVKKTSYSRIPISKSSPAPLSQDYIERHTPLPRSRHGSGAWSGLADGNLVYNKPRGRSHSAATQVLLDDGGDDSAGGTQPLTTQASHPLPAKSTQTPQPSTIRPKPRTPSAPLSTGHRNDSIRQGTKGHMKRRSRSLATRDGPSSRPGTRGGESRPATAINRPEGEAPWIATMYKPDPRLPPDQQIIPTHAKRLHQEQLAREAAEAEQKEKQTATRGPKKNSQEKVATPQREMSEFQKTPQSSQPAGEPPADLPEKPAAVRPAPSRSASSTPGARPTTSASERNQYTVMPAIQRKITPPQVSTRQTTRLHPIDSPEPRKQKGGCGGCCIVM